MYQFAWINSSPRLGGANSKSYVVNSKISHNSHKLNNLISRLMRSIMNDDHS